MSKLNYSTNKHLMEMIKVHSETLKKLLQEIEIYRKYVLDLADECLEHLEEAQREEQKHRVG